MYRTILLLAAALLPIPSMAYETQVDRVLVEKSKRKMYLLAGDAIIREYDIALGDNPVGHKQQEGDERTPEGEYVIDYRNPNSRYHLSLHISYPNEQDRQRARARGVSPGGMIMIHGLPNGYDWADPYATSSDWTDGCIAVGNRAIEEIWTLVDNGTPIRINP